LSSLLKTLLICAVAVSTMGFRPFTPVNNVCPTCKGIARDTVVLINGVKVSCSLIAQTPEYYVVQRFKELRVIAKAKVSSVKWRNEGPRQLTSQGDVVVLRGGIAFYGKVVRRESRHLVIEMGKRQHIVWYSKIEAAYSNGNKTPIPKSK
jgi:ribosomal protein L36